MELSEDHRYIPAFRPPKGSRENAWVLVLIDKKLLMMKAGAYMQIPKTDDLKEMVTNENDIEYIGEYEGHSCYCTTLNAMPKLPDHFELIDLKEVTECTKDPGLFILAGTVNHLVHWNNANQYCGCCGQPMKNKEDERAKVCLSCGNIVYPRISPATITAILRDDQILLAHNRNFKKDLYSLIAGFVEPGETLEQCVEREIREEVGIKVKNIKYFCSQPWPFPDSLMMAFTAEYESGEICEDQFEIMDAAWFKADSLPPIPSADSVAGKLIRWYQSQHESRTSH